jgi:alkanesulfonate monooxygenase SsuD/methylene tetrahydromethanopterin reductase-like flavin-dependent oxidoreductase (luciferase family)
VSASTAESPATSSAGVGVLLRSGAPPTAAAVVSNLVQAIDAGLGPALLTEVSGAASTVVLASVATQRPGATIGTAVAPLGSRSEATLAMEAATIAAVSGAPFLLGVGLSAPAIVERWHDTVHDPRVDTTRRRLLNLRALLDGERQGAFALGAGGDRVRLLLGCLGPRMQELAFEVGADAIVNLTPARAIQPPPPDATLYATVWVGLDDEAEAAARREIVSYATSPPYARHLRRLGWGDVVDRVHELRERGQLRRAPDDLPEGLVAELYVDAAELGARLRTYREAHAHPILLPVAGRDPVAGVDAVLEQVAGAR